MSDKVKKRLLTTVLVLILLAGLSLMLYPAVADYVNTFQYHTVIREYQKQVEALDESTYNEVLEAAKAYNAELAANTPVVSLLSEERREVYNGLLSIAGTGIMGYINIPKVNIFLPIYHGTEDSVLGMGVGHFEGSSLPVGGETVNTVLSAHSGLPSSKLFTNLDQLEIGDTFSLHVLNESLYYEIDSIEVVLPEELNNLRIEEGHDYCTLTTCTPYGVNTHRLVVRGHRFEVEREEAAIQEEDNTVAVIPNPAKFHPELLIVPAVAVVGLIIFVFISLLRRRRRR